MFLFFIPTLKAFETPAPPAGDGDGAADAPDEFASADHDAPAAAAAEAEGGADEESKAPPAFYAHAGESQCRMRVPSRGGRGGWARLDEARETCKTRRALATTSVRGSGGRDCCVCLLQAACARGEGLYGGSGGAGNVRGTRGLVVRPTAKEDDAVAPAAREASSPTALIDAAQRSAITNPATAGGG